MTPDEIKRLRALCDALEGLLPELEYSRQTHVQWRDCDQAHRDRNPDIGDKKFHEEAVQDYDKRLRVIHDAITALNAQDKEIELLKSEIGGLEARMRELEHGWLATRQRELQANGMKVDQAKIHAETEFNCWERSMDEVERLRELLRRAKDMLETAADDARAEDFSRQARVIDNLTGEIERALTRRTEE